MSTLQKVLVVSTLLLFMPYQQSLAAKRDSIVWLADGISISGIQKIGLYPVTTEADIHDKYDPGASISATVLEVLKKAGITVNALEDNTQPTKLALKIHIAHFQSGSVGGRWVTMGGGAAVCILRTFLVDGASGKIIGEIIVAKQVAAGGLFSAGAEKQVPKDAAKQTAAELAELLGIKPE
jgi:hypothetical protein